LGLAWWMKNDEVTAKRFFHYIPMMSAPSFEQISQAEIDSIEQEFIEDGSSTSSTLGRLLDLREHQKESIFSDLHLLVEQCNNKYIKVPKTEDLLPDDLLELAKEFVKTYHLLIKKRS
jgi:hypothetical protein